MKKVGSGGGLIEIDMPRVDDQRLEANGEGYQLMNGGGLSIKYKMV